MPCEAEALAIAAAVKHFAPYLIQSAHTPTVMTDSKACVQAAERLSRGDFSASPRINTFLSTIARYQINLQHISGANNLVSDYGSRNTPKCEDKPCQICSFVEQTSDTVVRQCTTSAVTVQDILSGRAPFLYSLAGLPGRRCKWSV